MREIIPYDENLVKVTYDLWLSLDDWPSVILNKRVTGSLGTPNIPLRGNNVITRRQDWEVIEEAKTVS